MSVSKLKTEPVQTLIIRAVYDSYQEFEDALKSYSESTLIFWKIFWISLILVF